jgi:SAM-dependent methyltransferase
VIAEQAGSCIPVLIAADEPESVFEQIDSPCDLFFSSYVFELLPSTGYALRILRVAHELLRPGGVALIQVRYHSGLGAVSGERLDYARNWLSNTSFSIEGFWTASQDVGFEPLYVTLVPRQPELDESRYAYFALKK